MVQPPPRVSPSGRPDCVLTRSASKPITTGKYEEFRNHLRKILDRPTGAGQALPTPETRSSDARLTEREILSRPDVLPSLAPEVEPSVGRGGGEVAEWFSLINPAGGVAQPTSTPQVAALTPLAVAEVTQLVERWVRRMALGGDQRRGAVRLDIGQGRFAGAELLVVAEAGHVSVELNLPPSLVDAELSERLRSRLERRGLAADVVVR